MHQYNWYASSGIRWKDAGKEYQRNYTGVAHGESADKYNWANYGVEALWNEDDGAKKI